MTIKTFESILLKVEHISYTMGTCALPDIYTLALGPASAHISGKALIPMVWLLHILYNMIYEIDKGWLP